MLLNYPTKKELKTHVGEPLDYIETSCCGTEYDPNGEFLGCNRPHISGFGREFFATVIMENGLIKEVR